MLKIKAKHNINTEECYIYLQGLHRYHDRNVRGHAFSPGDLDLRKVQKRKHKLSAIWEDPYITVKWHARGLISAKIETGRQSISTTSGT